MRKLSVLQVNKFYYPYVGGIEQVVRQIAEGLHESMEMQVLVCRTRGKTKNEWINGVKVCRAAGIGKIGNLPIPISFLHQFRRLSKTADIVQFHMPFPFGDLACLLSGYRGKVVIWWHSDIVRQKRWMFFYRPLMKQFLKRADQIIVATKGHLEGSDDLKPYRDKCTIIPFGVSVKLEERADQYWLQIYGKRNESDMFQTDSDHLGSLRFLFIGRLVYYKGCDVLLSAFAKLLMLTGKPHELVLVGTGPLEQKLKSQASQQGISNHVVFTGELTEEELYSNLEQCDVFVLPSTEKSEAFGLVQMEAMAFGKPVINTRLPSGVPYVSLDQVTGLTVTPGDKKALTEAMLWMTIHPEERIRMGDQARTRMKREFRLQTMLSRMEALYHRLMEG